MTRDVYYIATQLSLKLENGFGLCLAGVSVRMKASKMQLYAKHLKKRAFLYG